MAKYPEISIQQMEVYRGAARRMPIAVDGQIDERRRRAWVLLRAAATLLKKEYGAYRVAVFGSLVHEDSFRLASDVDIAAWGIRPEETFRAMGAVWALSEEIEINLVDIATARAGLVDVIEREGIDL